MILIEIFYRDMKLIFRKMFMGTDIETCGELKQKMMLDTVSTESPNIILQ